MWCETRSSKIGNSPYVILCILLTNEKRIHKFYRKEYESGVFLIDSSMTSLAKSCPDRLDVRPDYCYWGDNLCGGQFRPGSALRLETRPKWTRSSNCLQEKIQNGDDVNGTKLVEQNGVDQLNAGFYTYKRLFGWLNQDVFSRRQIER